MKHLIRKFRRLGAPSRVKSIPPALHLRPSFVPLPLPVSITERRSDRAFLSLLFSSRCYSIIDPIDADLPVNSALLPRTRFAFFSPLRKKRFQIHSNFELILKFREQKDSYTRYSPIAYSKHVCPSFSSFFPCFAHPVEPRRVHQFRAKFRLPVSINFCTAITVHSLVHQFNHALYNHSSRGISQTIAFTNRYKSVG